MAKTSTKKETAPKMEIVLMEGVEKTIQIASDDLILNTIGSQKDLDQIVETFSGFIITGIDDMVSYNATKDAAKKLQKLRTDVDKHRKSLTEPALKWQKDLKAVADKIIEQIRPVEDKLNDQITDIDDKRKAQEKKLFTDRAKLLADAGFQLVGGSYILGPIHVPTDSIIKLADKEMDFYLNEGKKEQERKAAADKEWQDRMDALAEREKALAEREAKLNKKDAELNAQEAAIEKTYEKIERAVDKQVDENPMLNPDAITKNPPEFNGNNFSANDIPETFSNAENNDNIDQHIMDHADASYTKGYDDGFNYFRLEFLNKMESDEKFTRSQLVEWAKSLVFILIN